MPEDLSLKIGSCYWLCGNKDDQPRGAMLVESGRYEDGEFVEGMVLFWMGNEVGLFATKFSKQTGLPVLEDGICILELGGELGQNDKAAIILQAIARGVPKKDVEKFFGAQ